MRNDQPFRARRWQPSGAWRRTALAAACVAMTWAGSRPARAATFTLNDVGLNSTIDIDSTSQAGVTNWVVDGVDHLTQQWFWYRVGGVGGEASLDTLVHDDMTDAILSNTNFTPGNDSLLLRYFDPLDRFRIEVSFTLLAGVVGSNTSSLNQQISIINTSASTLDFRFFMFSDFDVMGTPGLDSVDITGGNTATQTDSTTSVFAQSASTPLPTRVQADSRTNLLTALNNGTPTTLNNVTMLSGDSDSAWAFQWNRTIPVGGNLVISNTQAIVAPEPSSIALALAGGLGVGLAIWRRRRVRR